MPKKPIAMASPAKPMVGPKKPVAIAGPAVRMVGPKDPIIRANNGEPFGKK